jgi:hypothetical protein
MKKMVHYGQMLFHFSLSMWMENKTSNIGRCKAELKLNNTLAVSGEQSRPMLSSNKDVALAHLVFGSWPRSEFQKSFEEDDIFSEKISTSPGVVACLSEVKVIFSLSIIKMNLICVYKFTGQRQSQGTAGRCYSGLQ